jgi:hypothetical protein
MNIAFIVAVVCFVLAGLAPILGFDLGKFHAIAWGLAALAVGFLWPVGVRRTP